METYSNIIVAVDASDESHQVLHIAKSLAGDRANMTILHVIQRPVTVYGQAQSLLPRINEQQVRESLYSRLSDIVNQVGLNRESIRVHFGETVDEIINLALEQASQLIILGSHGRHGIRLLLGTTANGVLHHAPCDVLAVRIREDSLTRPPTSYVAT